VRVRSQPAPGVGCLSRGRYELGHAIGRGGMSTVHRAYDRCTGHEVAVKISRPAPDVIDAIGPIRREVGLVDFGIATTVESTSLAVDDATVGTANYLSPERSAHRAG
jgi:serine/threonine protein kinase